MMDNPEDYSSYEELMRHRDPHNYRVVIELDPEAPYEFLADEPSVDDPENHSFYIVSLQRQCSHCEQWKTVNSVAGVQFYLPNGDWPDTGTFDLSSTKVSGYARQIVNEMLMEEKAA